MWRLMLFFAGALTAQELSRIEVNVSAWRPAIRGTIQSGLLPIDLRSDLAMQEAWRLAGSVHLRFARRHGIVVEGSPMQFTGRNRLSRLIEYSNRMYSVQDTVSSAAGLADVFVGTNGIFWHDRAGTWEQDSAARTSMPRVRCCRKPPAYPRRAGIGSACRSPDWRGEPRSDARKSRARYRE